jgi:hypothetical protein
MLEIGGVAWVLVDNVVNIVEQVVGANWNPLGVFSDHCLFEIEPALKIVVLKSAGWSAKSP